MINCDLKGKVTVITGASRGIGREIALAFARSGSSVVLASRANTLLDDLSETIRAENGTAVPCVTDVRNPAAVHALVAAAFSHFKKIDILINNAGANYISSLVLSKDERWRETFETNVFGVYNCTKAVLPAMMRAKSGRIINIASIAGVLGAAHNSAYSAAKAAVIGFTKSIAREVGRLGITANAICPWHVDTEGMHAAMGARARMFGSNSEDYIKNIVVHHPQRRLIQPQEVAALALFLSSDDAAGISGEILNQCGGVVAA
jgi:NAD(P)-dependent dehydrogenase (short-subunit alcohol dehydrogenase family)